MAGANEIAPPRPGGRSMQERIKSAVSGETESPQEDSAETNNMADTSNIPMTQEEGSEMEPSITDSQAAEQPTEQESQQEYQAPAEQPQAQDGSEQYQYQDQYSSYQPVSVSSDTMSEVAEQVVAEKMGPIASTIEKLLDQRATTDSQIQYIDERLKRIEKIIDRLQLSILQKVGDYVTNVEDIKREVIETQKTFKSVLGQRDKSKNQ